MTDTLDLAFACATMAMRVRCAISLAQVAARRRATRTVPAYRRTFPVCAMPHQRRDIGPAQLAMLACSRGVAYNAAHSALSIRLVVSAEAKASAQTESVSVTLAFAMFCATRPHAQAAQSEDLAQTAQVFALEELHVRAPETASVTMVL